MEKRTGNIITLENLEIGFGQGRKKRSISGPLNCTASRGELIALMGRNGCGKSTLLRTLAGLQDPLQGLIRLENRLLEDFNRKELSRLLGFVSTEVIRVRGLRVRDLVAMGRYPHTGWFGNLGAQDQTRIENAIEITSLGILADRDMDELSDGERQRAMIARTLAQDTGILILDEPTAFLDITHRFEIISLLGKLAGEHGKTIVFSSHDLQLSLQAADKIWLMHGQDIIEGAPEDLVLNGQLEEGLLQDSASENFTMDSKTGDLSVRRDSQRTISLSGGTEDLRVWTIRAVERTGFIVEQNKKLPIHVFVEENKGNSVWHIEKNGQSIELNSIYDLSLYLRTIV